VPATACRVAPSAGLGLRATSLRAFLFTPPLLLSSPPSTLLSAPLFLIIAPPFLLLYAPPFFITAPPPSTFCTPMSTNCSLFLLFLFFFLFSDGFSQAPCRAQPGEASNWDSSRFTSEIAWHRYQDNIQLWNILPERNVELGPRMFDEFLQELRRRRLDQVLTHLPEKRIDVALVKEFYSRQCDLSQDI